MTEFQGVIPAFNQALTKRGYTTLTEVQNAVLAPELIDQDLLVSAQTGSGKTVAFGLAFAPTLLEGAETLGKVQKPLALVIAPTRELAMQVSRELEWLYQPCKGIISTCVGGMDIRTERTALKRGPHIVVGTPGRLRDHIERGYLDPSQLKAVVLDEADEMLDMGFRDELQYILETAPKERRTLLFSATVPKSIASLAKRYQNDARRISTKDEKKQHVDIEYQALTIAPSDRENAIINILRFHEAKNAIIFCATRAAVNLLTSRLTNRGFSVVALSGELSQNERTHALQALRDGRAKVCVATDVASRGIDLPGLALVIHADIPKNSDILLHRSGRTGRAGSKGVSAVLVPHNARFRAERLLNNAKIEAKWDKPPSIKDITTRDHERFLSHPALNDEIKPDEQPAVDELLERFTPTQVAAALMRLHNTQKPAPEELLENAPKESQRNNRDGFKNSVWVSISVGRNVNAEPRWILPMLCGAGNLTKGKIGAIKIQQNETFIEMTADAVDGFFEAVGPSGKMEKDIIVKRVKGTPSISRDEGGRPKRSFNDKKKPYDKGGRSSERSNSRPGPGGEKRSFGDKKKPYRDDGKPSDRAGSSEGKRPFKKKYDERGPHDGKPGEGNSSKGGFKGKPKGDFKGKPKGGFKDKPKGDFKSKPKGGFQDKPKGDFKSKPKGGGFNKTRTKAPKA
ncbi:MAG: DEAD/DEAH box helicase [Rickettsiales bacterium]|nr:DEAD/DEAH box helicase [Rickettsiales bacterium]